MAVCTDCDDGDANNYPTNAEVCDGADNDCDLVADNGLTFADYWPDLDGDGYGDGAVAPTNTCDGAPPNSIDNPLDCDDVRFDVNPAQIELTCDGLDNDCDVATEDEPDGDGDGSSLCFDCDDADPNNSPIQAEVCDGQDNDCDALVDDGLTFLDYWPDVDGDTFGDALVLPTTTCSGPPAGHVSNNIDCDDVDANNYPTNAEVCDGRDNNCDLVPDDGLTFVDYYPDNDADGFGSAAVPAITTCDGPPLPSWLTDNTDCDDGTGTVFPGAPETTADGIDQDCDGADDCYQDADVDGVGVALVIGGTTLDCSASGESDRDDDCDDADPNNSPIQPELCDGQDNDCDTLVDEESILVDYWPDADGDGYGDGSVAPVSVCTGAPAGFVDNPDDCDDTLAIVNPGQPELTCDGLDNDCNVASLDAPDADGDGVAVCTDCDDGDANNYPTNAEVCDGRDNDCDTVADNGLSFVDYWPDADGDGYGNPLASPTNTCSGPPAGQVANNADCDDADGNNHPTNVEVCDGRDNDCDLVPDNGLTFVDYYPDNDADGFGSAAVPATTTCDGPPLPSWLTDNTDCDDGSGTVFPGAPETTADGIDQDCDSADDCYRDLDLDGVGTPVVIGGATLDCSAFGESVRSDDCDDADGGNYPGNAELCDGVDNDCDTLVDEESVFVDYWPDVDGDGYGDGSSPPVSECAGAPVGYVANPDDCDDTLFTVNPGAVELTCNGRDDDCNVATLDARDGDGDGVDECSDCDDGDANNYPTNPEICDGQDNDCDTLVDEGLTFTDYWPDGDADGWGNPLAAPTTTCDGPPAGQVPNDADCDDADASLNQDDIDLDSYSTCDGDCDDLAPATFPGRRTSPTTTTPTRTATASTATRRWRCSCRPPAATCSTWCAAATSRAGRWTTPCPWPPPSATPRPTCRSAATAAGSRWRTASTSTAATTSTGCGTSTPFRPTTSC